MNASRMRIPVFVSAPSPNNLSPQQDAGIKVILNLINRYRFEWRALGRSDYPLDLPLREVLQMIKHCSGGIILGFEQFRSAKGELMPGSKNAKTFNSPVSFATPWNQLEAGMLFSHGIPLMIFREAAIFGGIFDVGTSEVFVHHMPTAAMGRQSLDDLDAVFQKWAGRVRGHYYGE